MISNLLSITSIFKTFGYILIAIVVLLFMVLIHELGHYIAGKILKFKINEFSVGFGPKILQKKKKNGELISLRAFPLGGYCAFEGEGEDGNKNPEAFNNQKPWKRLIVLFSGAFFNLLSAIIFSFILLMCSGFDLVEVKTANPNSINYGYLQEGDIIYGVGDEKINFVSDKYFASLIVEDFEKYKGEDLKSEYSFTEDGKVYYMVKENQTFMIERDGEKMTVSGFVNVFYNTDGECAGWTLLETEAETQEFALKSYKYSFWEALRECVPFTFKWAWKVLVIFGQLITGQLSLTSLGGPVTTIKILADQTSQGTLMIWLPLIAVNLAVFNLLPIPALDGCQMLFVGIEWIRKKPIKQEVVNVINNIGLVLLLGFVIVIDVIQMLI